MLQFRYEGYAHKRGWKFEVVDVTESDLKGIKVAIFNTLMPMLEVTTVPYEHGS